MSGNSNASGNDLNATEREILERLIKNNGAVTKNGPEYSIINSGAAYENGALTEDGAEFCEYLMFLNSRLERMAKELLEDPSDRELVEYYYNDKNSAIPLTKLHQIARHMETLGVKFNETIGSGDAFVTDNPNMRKKLEEFFTEIISHFHKTLHSLKDIVENHEYKPPKGGFSRGIN